MERIETDGGLSMAAPYAPRLPCRCEHVRVGDLDYAIRRWGDPAAPPLLLLHGGRDCGATFQFLIDALKGEWSIVAPDWRGHGLSARARRGYWTHDFLADLDVLVEALFPDMAIDLVAHSMGGNIGGLYAGLRPARIRRFVALDAFGPPANRLPVDPHALLADHLKPWPEALGRGYGSVGEAAARLMAANRRLTPDKALFLAEASSSLGADGRRRWLFDPGMKRSLLTLHTIDEWAAVWARVEAPVLWIASGDIRDDAPSFPPAVIAERRRLMPQAAFHRLEDTGHNLHHDRPADAAAIIEAFLLARGD